MANVTTKQRHFLAFYFQLHYVVLANLCRFKLDFFDRFDLTD